MQGHAPAQRPRPQPQPVRQQVQQQPARIVHKPQQQAYVPPNRIVQRPPPVQQQPQQQVRLVPRQQPKVRDLDNEVRAGTISLENYDDMDEVYKEFCDSINICVE